ncbi:MAG TPA: hypothetical protein PKM65_04965 [Spirochaetota bacterium]|nr:hypothetical protein [Spirochaetota bacterium]HNT10298.1 hypothetical protein [Spirochaetota bacterium]
MPVFLFVVWVSGVAAIAVYQLVSAIRRNRRFTRCFKEVADAYGLTFIRGSLFFFPKAYGSHNGFSIIVEKTTEGKQECLRIKVAHVRALDLDLYIRKESLGSRLMNAVTRCDIVTGDRALDEMLYFHASRPAHVAATMNFETRKRLEKLSRQWETVSIKQDVMFVTRPLDRAVTASMIVECVDSLMAIGAAFADDGPLRARLMRNIERDPEPEVRIANLRALAAAGALDDEARSVLRRSCDDANAVVRFEAARLLGEEGFAHCEALLASPGSIDDALMAEILRYLRDRGRRVPADALMACYRGAALLATQLEVLAAMRDAADPRLCAFLVERLANDDSDIIIAAMQALETCGDISAVEKIYAKGKASLNPFVRSAANRAIAQIQSRLGKADKGWLSLTETDGTDGALSVADGAGEGALSVEVSKKNRKG